MELAAALTQLLGTDVIASSERRVPGGSINKCSCFDSAAGPIFVKHGGADCLPIFQAEAAGLAELANARAARIPQVLAVGGADANDDDSDDSWALLALEWIEFSAASAETETKFGELLAAQHRITRDQFGWDRDNTIG